MARRHNQLNRLFLSLTLILLFLTLPQSHAIQITDCTESTCQAQGNPFSELKKVSIKLLCDAPVTHSSWEKVAPKKPPQTMTVEQLTYYLLRFQKLGGYDPLAHADIMKFLMGEDTSLATCLKEIRKLPIYQNSMLLAQLDGWEQAEYLLKNPGYSTEHSSLCLSASEKTLVKKDLSALVTSPKELSKLDFLKIKGLAELFLDQPVSEREEFVQRAVLKYSENLVQEHPFKGIFLSKLYYLTHPLLAEPFQIPFRHASDISVDPSGSSWVLSSSAPIDGIKSDRKINESPSTSWRRIPEVEPYYEIRQFSPNETTPLKVTFKTHGETLTATLTQSKYTVSQIKPKTVSPDYKKMLGDRNLTGLVILGANMVYELKDSEDFYLNFLKQREFKITGPFPETQTKKAIFDKINSGEVDYVIKEAHSGGDDQNLMIISEDSKYYFAEKKPTDGKKHGERFWIYIPSVYDARKKTYRNDAMSIYSKVKRIDVADLKTSIEARSKAEQAPLVFINGSCNSKYKSDLEITEIASKDLINLGSQGSALANTPNGGKYILLDSIRNLDPYDKMDEYQRELSGQSNPLLPQVQSAEKGERYVLPNDPGYGVAEGADPNATYYRTKVDIRDAKGQYYLMGRTYEGQ